MDIEDNLIFGFKGQFRFLSNFYPVPHGVVYCGIRYPTVEHAYVAGKTTCHETRMDITRLQYPRDVKELGRSIPLRHDWEDIKLLHMEGCLRNKFKRGSGLATRLMRTGDATIVEANTWGDTFWGRCRGRGKNHLGHLLMEIRQDLQAEQGQHNA